MEHLSACVTDRMITLGIISSDDRDSYCYSVQVLLEKTICLTMIILLASLFHSLFGVIAFLCVFMLIRRSADGIHCKTAIGCFCASTLMALSTIWTSRILNCYSVIWVGMVVCSVIVLCIIATVNNPNLNLTNRELGHLKKRSRITSLVLGVIIVTAILIIPNDEIVYYLALGVIYNALSLLIAIITERRRNQNDGKEKT